MSDDRWRTQGLRLTQDYLNGEITDADMEQFENLLLECSATRTQFRRYTRNDVALREMAEGVGEEPVPLKFSQPRPHGGSVIGRWLQVAAMVAMAGALVYLLAERSDRLGIVRKITPPSAEESRPRLVQGGEFQDGAMAVLTHAVGVEWVGDLAYAEGAALRPDTLKISKGLLQIEFYSGATVVVEGPAEFELVDPMHAVLVEGSVRGNVPHFATGFSIESSELTLVDIGTEFGFSAEKDGAKEVHVFDGEVRVRGGALGADFVPILKGSALRVAGGSKEFFTAEDEAFADSQQIASLASEAEAHQREQWNRYAEGLKDNSDVLLFYSFDNKVAWSRRLSNGKKMVADPLYGAIVGCQWAEGRWQGKAALEFKRRTDRVRIGIPGDEHDVLTLMTWVRIDGFDRELNSLMLSDGWEPGGAHWQITQSGEIILGVRGDEFSAAYKTPPVLGQGHLGRWIHLAVSYGGPGGQVVQFLNGRPIWSGEVKQHQAINVLRGELGNWSSGNWSRTDEIDIRNLNGRMDEFLVFSAALDPGSVKDIYQKGRPR